MNHSMSGGVDSGGYFVDVNKILADTHDISFSELSLKNKELQRLTRTI